MYKAKFAFAGLLSDIVNGENRQLMVRGDEG